MPTGTALREAVEGFKETMASLSVLESLMAHTFPLCLPLSALPTTSTGKAAIQSSCRGQWMIGVDS